MRVLTEAQIDLAYDMEAIQEALAGGFILPPPKTLLDTPFAQKMRKEFEDENQHRRDGTAKDDADRQRQANEASGLDRAKAAQDATMKTELERKLAAQKSMVEAVQRRPAPMPAPPAPAPQAYHEPEYLAAHQNDRPVTFSQTPAPAPTPAPVDHMDI